jgi:alpha-glucosidase
MIRFATACFLLLTTPLLAAAELRHAGNVVATSVLPSGAELTLEGGARARVEVLANATIRVRFVPSGTFSTFETGALAGSPALAADAAVYDTASGVFIVTPAFTTAVFKAPYRVVVWRANGELLQADLSPAVSWDTSSGAIYTRKWAPSDERYYGFGERGGPLNRRGRSFVMQNKDLAAFGPLQDPLYISIPYFWGARGGDVYGIYVDNSEIPFFDADAQSQGALLFGALSDELDYFLFVGPSPRQVAESYGRLTGFSTLPPRWTLGYHQSRYGYTSQAQLLTVAATLRALQLPTDVVYLDIDYLDRLQMFSWNLDAFPNPHEMNQLLRQMGFRQVNIMEPIVHTGDRFWLPLASAGYFLKDFEGDPLINTIWFGTVSWLDFTKSAATAWYRQMLAAFLQTGIDGVWNDLNEPAANDMPYAVYDFDGNPRLDYQARNLYALREAAISYDAQLDVRPNLRPWGISRAGFAGIQRYIANWGGDALSDWETLRTNVQMSLSMALSGQNFFGHDIGGFLGAPDAELFTRWMEFSAYTPLFRNHAMNTSPAREPWAFGEPTLSHARNIINERYRLLPYLYTLFERASRTGEPALAPTFFYFPHDSTTWNDDASFMVGESMLVAPVIWQGLTSRPVYLPAGSRWYDAATDAVIDGGTFHDASAPLGRTPVFVRAPAIIPKGPVLQHTDERPLTDLLVHLYRAAGSFSTTFEMYEDDGISFDYRAGAYLRTQIGYEGSSSLDRVVIERRDGSWTPPPGRTWTLELHGLSSATAITVGGAALPFFASTPEFEQAASGWTVVDRRVTIRVADSSSSIAVEVQHASLP